MKANIQNWSISEEIRDYWSDRADTFDFTPGHHISDGPEARAWRKFFSAAVGFDSFEGLSILDLACGTGEISRMALDLKGNVTGVDFSEAMLKLARHKHLGRPWTGLQIDAQTLPGVSDEKFHAAFARHLFWTLTEPEQALRRWMEVLMPGGTLVLVDGNWVKDGLKSRLFNMTAGFIDAGDHERNIYRARHQNIMHHLPFGQGLTKKVLIDQLTSAGFVKIRALPIWSVYALGMRNLQFHQWLRLNAYDRFAIAAQRPA